MYRTYYPIENERERRRPRGVAVYFRPPFERLTQDERRQWATRDDAFFPVITLNGGQNWVWTNQGQMVQTACVHTTQDDDDDEAARRRAIEEHRQALDIHPWDAGLDYSATSCVHSLGLRPGVDPRNAKRRDRTLLKHCLRRVAPLWTCMSAHERTSIPVELVEKISEKVASAGYGAE